MLSAFTMETSYLENNSGHFTIKPLPVICQISSVDGMAVLDINGDGALDIVMAGNTDAVQPDIGRTDASYGAVLLGDGHGGFTSLEPGASGFVARGQARCLVPVAGSKGEVLLVVSRNQARPLLYSLPHAKMSAPASKKSRH